MRSFYGTDTENSENGKLFLDSLFMATKENKFLPLLQNYVGKF